MVASLIPNALINLPRYVAQAAVSDPWCGVPMNTIALQQSYMSP